MFAAPETCYLRRRLAMWEEGFDHFMCLPSKGFHHSSLQSSRAMSVSAAARPTRFYSIWTQSPLDWRTPCECRGEAFPWGLDGVTHEHGCLGLEIMLCSCWVPSPQGRSCRVFFNCSCVRVCTCVHSCVCMYACACVYIHACVRVWNVGPLKSGAQNRGGSCPPLRVPLFPAILCGSGRRLLCLSPESQWNSDPWVPRSYSDLVLRFETVLRRH